MAKEATLDFSQLKTTFVQELRKQKSTPGIYNYDPWERQLEFHNSLSKGKIFMGGNRAGKTVSGAAETVMRLIGYNPYRKDLPKPPIRARGVAVDFDRGVNLIMLPELKKWIPSDLLIEGRWDKSYNKSERMLTLSNGSTMEFMSYEQDVGKFQGTSRHWVWFDEEPPQSIFNECMLRLVDTDGDWCITMTPLIEMSWTYDSLYEPALSENLRDVEVFTADTKDNPHIKHEAFDRLTQTLSEEEKKTRGTGSYISHTGLVYGESFDTDVNVLPDLIGTKRWDVLRKDWEHFQMMDHGYTNNTVFLFGCYNSDGKILIYDELVGNKTIISDWAEKVKLRRLELDIKTAYTIGDPSIASRQPESGKSVQTTYSENGIFIGLGNNDVDNGIYTVQEFFRHGQLLITKRCTETLKELRKYRWDRHLTKLGDRKNKKEQPIKKDDHCMDALRYGVMSSPMAHRMLQEKVSKEVPEASHVASDFDWEMVNKDLKIIDEHLGSEF